jgi:cytochrome c oxidase assembly factor CtaG
VWHIPSVFMLGMRSQLLHGIEQASFLATGLLFWLPVTGSLPTNWKWPESSILLYLFLATLPCDILSGFLVFCDRVVYPVFLSYPGSFGLSALEDQQCAGALMWTCVTVVYLIAGAVFTARLLSPQVLPQRSPQRSSHRTKKLAIPQFDSQRISVQHTDPHKLEAV